MALGWCPTCDRLVPIKAGSYRWGERTREWWPLAHEGQDGKLCPGPKKAL